MAEHAEVEEREEHAPVRLEQPKRLLGCGARPLHVAEVRQHEGLDVQGPAAAGLPLALLGQLPRGCGALERLPPASGIAVDQDQVNLREGIRELVAVRERFRRGSFEDLAGTIGLVPEEQTPPEPHGGAVEERQRLLETLLDRNPTLEQPRRDVERNVLEYRHTRDRRGEQDRVADLFGFLERGPRMHEAGADVSAEGAVGGETCQDARAAGVVSLRFAQRRLRRARSSPGGFVVTSIAYPASRKSTSARSTPCGTSARSCSRIVRARSPSPERMRSRAAWRRRPRPADASSGGVSAAASSASSAAAALAPRPAASSLASSSSRATDASGSVRRERQVAGALLAIRDHLGKRPMRRAPRRAGCLLVADRRQQRMREANVGSVQADHTLAHGQVERVQRLLAALPVHGREQLDRRTRGRGRRQQHVGRLRGQPRQAHTQELAQALGQVQRLTRRGPRTRPRQLTRELEREERVTPARVQHPNELRTRQLERETRLQQRTELGRAERRRRSAA